MPELPEEERAAKLLRNSCLLKRVLKTLCFEQGLGPREGLVDEKFYANCDKDLVQDAFTNQICDKILTKVERKGKYIFLTFCGKDSKEERFLMLHFGMTGSISVDGVERFTFEDFKVDEKWPPRYCKMEIIFNDDDRTKKEIRIAVTDPRRLARIYILDEHPNTHEKIKILAKDALLDDLDANKVLQTCWKSQSVIKSLLLDQSKVCCGLGNYLVDEILYHAEIHPETKCNTLSREQIKIMIEKIKKICSVAVDLDGVNYPKDWIFHERWQNKKKKRKRDDELELSIIKVGGRTTCFDAKKQKKGQRNV